VKQKTQQKGFKKYFPH